MVWDARPLSITTSPKTQTVFTDWFLNLLPTVLALQAMGCGWKMDATRLALEARDAGALSFQVSEK